MRRITVKKPQKKYSEIRNDLLLYTTWAQRYKYWTNLLASNALYPRRLVDFLLSQHKKNKVFGYKVTFPRGKPNPMLLAMIKSTRFADYFKSVPESKKCEFEKIFQGFFFTSNPFSARAKYAYSIDTYDYFKDVMDWSTLLLCVTIQNNHIFPSISTIIQKYYKEIFINKNSYNAPDAAELINTFWEAVAFGIKFPIEYLKESIEENKSVFGMDIVNYFYPVIVEYNSTKAFHPQLSNWITKYGSSHVTDFMNLLLSDDALALYCCVHENAKES